METTNLATRVGARLARADDSMKRLLAACLGLSALLAVLLVSGLQSPAAAAQAVDPAIAADEVALETADGLLLLANHHGGGNRNARRPPQRSNAQRAQQSRRNQNVRNQNSRQQQNARNQNSRRQQNARNQNANRNNNRNNWNNNRNNNWRNNNRYVVRPVRGWYSRPYYGTVIGGVALGSIIAATAVGMAPMAPASNVCWFWTDSRQVRGYWDYCRL